MSVILETTVGDITIDLYTDTRPRTCLNFLKLCKIKYYNYSLIHTVHRGFIAQTGGDPWGRGEGGESVFRRLYGDQARYYDAETHPKLKHVKRGTVSMVNNGQNMHGSQFFITLSEDLDHLDGVHTVFGEIGEGFAILDKLNEIVVDEDNKPYQDIRIAHTVVLDDPFDDPPGLQAPDRSPEPTAEQLQTDRIAPGESIDDNQSKTIDEIQEENEDRGAKHRSNVLEMIGDIPEADVRPPDNVLFVCKLNPVTTDEDLGVIFSRFGVITSCEVIRDHSNGESLGYAFIEFEREGDCENAYFKMDNVLIDDRRIHVDFSQSVSKLQNNKQKQLDDTVTNEKPYRVKDKYDQGTIKGKYQMVFEPDQDDKSQRRSHDTGGRRGNREESQSERRRRKRRHSDESPTRDSRDKTHRHGDQRKHRSSHSGREGRNRSRERGQQRR